MISYELAKKLKDAGFPQEIPKNYYVNSEGQIEDFESRWGGHWHTEDAEGMICAIPTLSELIEACGNDFANLHRNSENGRWDSWEARDENMNVYGSTPEEAVANLWLALNEK